MPMVGGFLGGGVEMVPAGSGQLCLQWLTPDRLNLAGAIFTVAGSTTTTVQAGADGRAEIIVPAGTYTVSVAHAGTYGNDKPQTVLVESTQSYLVMFGATSADISSLRLQCNEQFLGCNVEIRDAGGYIRASIDSISSQEYEYLLSAGTYTLAVGFGESEVEVMQSGATVVNLDDIFYAVPIIYSDVPINTSCVYEGRELIGRTFSGLKGETYSVSFSAPDMEQGKPYATVPDTTVSESLAELHPVASGVKYEFTSDRTLDLHGTFKVAVIGGGGGGSYGYTSNSGGSAGGGGGGGGYLTVGQFAVDDSSIKIICGERGVGGKDGSNPSTSGGASSFGNLLSASGGSGARGGSMDGGSGGAGGGGGSYQKNTSGGDGGSSTYGGGGGGGWARGAAGKTTLSTGGGSSGGAATSEALGGGGGGEANLPQILLDLGYSNGAGGSGRSGGGGGGLIGKGGDGNERFSSNSDAAGGGGGGGLGKGGNGSNRDSNGYDGGTGAGGGGGGGQGGYGGDGGGGAVIVKWVSR